MNVIVMKTLGGEEVIAELVERKENSVIVSRPRILHLTQQGAGLIPYILSDPDKRDVEISLNAISVIFPASKEISSSYLSAVTSIQLNG